MCADGELSYFFSAPVYSKEKLFWKDERDVTKLVERLLYSKEIIASLDEKDFTPEKVKAALWEYAEKEGRGQVLWPLRYALSGKEKSPDPFQLLSILGKKEAVARIEHALALYHERTP